MQPGPGGSSEASNAVLRKNRKDLPIHLIARKNNRRDLNAARSGNAAGTIKIGIELSDCLPRLATIVVGEGMRPNLLQWTRLDPPDQRRREVQRIVSLIGTNLLYVRVKPGLLVSGKEIGEELADFFSALCKQQTDGGPGRGNLRRLE